MDSYDDIHEQAARVMEAIMERSAHCERGIIATRADGRAGIALVGPDCVLFAEIFFPEMPPFDLCLN